MKRLTIGFLVDPILTLNPAYDTSLALMRECIRRGHTVLCCELKDLGLHHNTVEAALTKCAPDSAGRFRPAGQPRRLPLSAIDVFFIRKDPPFDLRYLSALYLLDRASRSGGRPFFVNDPAGILKTNEKLSVFPFEPLCPPGACGFTADAFRDFLKKGSRFGWVIKPLYDKGGRGIRRFKASERQKLLSWIPRLTRNGREPVICQHFVEHAATGDKRILILNGRALGAVSRIARRGEFRANLSLGATAVRAKITHREQTIVKRLVPFLRQRGLHFVGIDVLAGFLSEINVTSPSGIVEIDALDRVSLEQDVIRFVESAAR